MHIAFLSHQIGKKIPVYGQKDQHLLLNKVRSISRGDSCNVFAIGMENHWGTHVDCPRHFFKGGKKVAQYDAEYWYFEHPQIISVFLREGELLKKSHLPTSIQKKTDLLLFKSGWQRLRGKNEYCTKNPGIDPTMATYLSEGFPNLRALGLDWISVSSYLKREVGLETHRIFLRDSRKRHPILLIEDMDLRKASKKLKEVWVAPIRMDTIDSSPCTVFGVFN